MDQPISLDVTIFVPCYNEEKNIADVVDIIEAAMKTLPLTYEILIYDDNSQDRTVEVIGRVQKDKANMNIRLVRNERNRGLGTNYFRGSHEAKGRYYMLINGDNDAPVELIQIILREINKYDMVVPHLGKNDQRGFFRRTLSRTFTKIVQILSGTRLQYYNCAVLHQTENVRKWPVEDCGYGYQAELSCHLIHQGKTYVEVEVPHSLRQHGTTKAFRFSNFVAVVKSLWRIFLTRFQSKSIPISAGTSRR